MTGLWDFSLNQLKLTLSSSPHTDSLHNTESNTNPNQTLGNFLNFPWLVTNEIIFGVCADRNHACDMFRITLFINRWWCNVKSVMCCICVRLRLESSSISKNEYFMMFDTILIIKCSWKSEMALISVSGVSDDFIVSWERERSAHTAVSDRVKYGATWNGLVWRTEALSWFMPGCDPPVHSSVWV